MQIKKIISGGQTGADRAALDFAIEYGIEHGGWVPRGRKAEDGVIPARYNVQELTDGGYPERTAQNVIDSDATAIISHGRLEGGSKLTRDLAEKHAKPCLHIDVYKQIIFDAAIDLYEWAAANGVEILNIAGPRSSKDPDIYRATYSLLETAFHIDIISNAMPDLRPRQDAANAREKIAESLPQTVDAAVAELMGKLSPIDRMRIASTGDGRLERLNASWGRMLCEQFGLEGENNRLLEDCRKISGAAVGGEKAAMVILRAFRQKLKESGHLRVIK